MADSTFTIFYSWQSDLPNSTTRGLIESSIKQQLEVLEILFLYMLTATHRE